MQIICNNCGNRLSPDTVVCPHCGRVVTASQRRPQPPQNQQPRPRKRQAPPPQPAARPQPRRAAPPERQTQAPVRAKPSKPRNKFSELLATSSRAVKTVFSVLRIVFILAVIYFGIFFIQIYRVKLTRCDLDTSLKLSQSNYGQAIEYYFNDGSWSVNLLETQCSYKGTTRHREEMEIVFDAGRDIKVVSILIDGKPIKENLIETKLMAMFI